MKKLICLILCLVSLLLIGCGEDYEKSDAVFDLHRDCVEYIKTEDNFSHGIIFDDSLGWWVKSSFVESWVKFEEDDDFEIYIHLKYDTELEVMDEWFYVQKLGGDFCEVKRTNGLVVKAATLIGYKHTDKVDKKWE